MHPAITWAALGALAGILAGCGAPDGSDSDFATGGAENGTGAVGTGGIVGTGAAATGTGGVLPATGGAPLGGVGPTGGAPLGGVGPTGGAPLGGVGPTGGTTLTGGVGPTGGTAPTGGVAPTGGTAPTGGFAPTGGMPPTGGMGPTGGMTGETGGTGGAEPGGATTGGAETGGAATGGAETGGAATGGAETGGTATGGAETGGAGTGGTLGDDDLVGWATVSDCGPDGTTGGGDAEPITVTDGAALKAAMNTSEPAVIYVSGSIQTPGNISGRHNKTVIGINDAEIYGGWGLVGCTNIIVKNIKFRDGPNDSFGLSGSACIWVDHCEFVDGLDGNFDIANGTDFVTISWSRFYYTQGHDHMLACLVGNTQPNEADVGRENITFHHNWWGAGVRSRKPRVRYGQVHVFNNYYHYTPVDGDGGDNYDIGAGYQSKLLVENNYFDGSNTPITWMGDEDTAEVVERDNVFVDAGGVVTRGSAFTPPYEYQHMMEPGAQVRDSVTAGAGVQ